MREELIKIDECSDSEDKYMLTIEYMEREGIVFKPAQKDYLKNHYGIMSNNSSIFVYLDYFKLNLCEDDKIKLDGKFDLKFEPLYSNKSQQIRDKVRPWTCSFVGAELLEDIVNVLVGKKEEVGINVARLPKGYGKGGELICPNCNYFFNEAVRCPECGQLITRFLDIKDYFNKNE